MASFTSQIALAQMLLDQLTKMIENAKDLGLCVAVRETTALGMFQCTEPASVERCGHPYCGAHDPAMTGGLSRATALKLVEAVEEHYYRRGVSNLHEALEAAKRELGI